MKLDFPHEMQKTTFKDIQVGECFQHKCLRYLKVEPLTTREVGDAVRLQTGVLINFPFKEDSVIPLNLKVVKA